MPGEVWQPLKALCKNRLRTFTLPGSGGADAHLDCPAGHTRQDPRTTLNRLADALAAQLPSAQCLLTGWSLGAMVATHFALTHPQRVAALVLAGFNPVFTARHDWPAAMAAGEFDVFARQVNTQCEPALHKFVLLCTHGSKRARATARTLLPEVLAHKNAPVLQDMLMLLREDFRPALAQLHCPVIHVLATRDALVPAHTSTHLTKMFPGHRVYTVPGSHLFFYEKPGSLYEILIRAGADL